MTAKDIEGLSPRQAEVVRAVYAHLLAEGRVPTLRELAAVMGGSFTFFGFGMRGAHLRGLLEKGWVERDGPSGLYRKEKAWRLAGVSWAWLEDGTGAVRRVPVCDLATPEGQRLARVLAGAKAVAA